jgi:hypothetical protein
MRVFRFTFLLLATVSCAVLVTAQSSQENTFHTSSHTAVLHSTNPPLSAHLGFERGAEETPDQDRPADLGPQADRLLFLPFDPAARRQDDSVCYAIRGYRVQRDDAHSDSTHAAGYSTCQPALRFRTFTVTGDDATRP